MAKRRRSRDSADPTEIASQVLLSLPELSPPLVTLPVVNPDHGLFSDFGPTTLTEIEDGRTYNPSSISDASSVVGTVAPSRDIGVPLRDPLSTKVGFDRPEKTIICVRRKERREVIFAKGYRRRGKGGSRRRNFFSNIRC